MRSGSPTTRDRRPLRTEVLGPLALGLLLAATPGCRDPKQEHAVLSFFFDGVPPREDANTPSAPYAPGLPGQRRPEAVWIVHPPIRNCVRCHGQRRRSDFSGEVQLVATVPGLCAQCHPATARPSGWAHGPFAQGQCLLCHEPHRTLQPHLLRKPVPELCYQCHRPRSLPSIPGHDRPSYDDCTLCHTGHASPERFLLRPGPLYEALTTQRTRFEQGRSQADAGRPWQESLAAARDLAAAGPAGAARAYLWGLLLHGDFPDEGRRALAELGTTLDSQKAEQQQVAETHLEAAQRATAETYFRSLQAFQQGRWREARSGFEAVLTSGHAPAAITRALRDYLAEIDRNLIDTDPAAPDSETGGAP